MTTQPHRPWLAALLFLAAISTGQLYTGAWLDALVRRIPTFVYFSRDSLGAIQWHRLGMDPSGMQLPAMKPEKP